MRPSMYYIFIPPDNISYPNPNIEFLSKSLELKVDLTSLMIGDHGKMIEKIGGVLLQKNKYLFDDFKTFQWLRKK